LAKNASMSTCRIGQPVSSPSTWAAERGTSALRPMRRSAGPAGQDVHPARDLGQRRAHRTLVLEIGEGFRGTGCFERRAWDELGEHAHAVDLFDEQAGRL